VVRLRYIAVYDLEHDSVVIVCVQVEGLRLDARRVWREKLEVSLGHLGEGRIALILAHGLNGLNAVLGLLGTGDIGQPAHL
jgi:hypothetical protein